MNVLVVEDDAPYAKLLGIALERGSPATRIAYAQTLAEACEWVREADYDVILLDLGLPDSNGLATVRRLRDANDSVPIVILSGRDDDELAREAVRLGAEDYIVKGEQNREGIVRALQYAIVRHRNAGELRYLASHDPLTGLANRAHFLHELAQMIAAAEQAGQSLGVLSVDLDRFRDINERLGYRRGDQVLLDGAQRLDETLKRGDVAARIDADQFAVLPGIIADEHAAARLAERIHAAFAEPVEVGAEDLSVTVSIGVALYPADGETAEALLAASESAMHEAKERGRNRTHFFNEASARRLRRRRALRNDLEAAISGSQLEVRYQVRFGRVSRAIHSIAAAPFWHHPSRGLLGPEAFYPDAEREGLAERIDEYLIERAAERIGDWATDRDSLPFFSLPLSARLLRMPELTDYIENILLVRSIAPTQIEIAVGDAVVFEAPEQAPETIHKLHDLGVRIALRCGDGSAASLRRIARLPLDSIVLASSLVETGEAGGFSVVKALIVLAHDRGFSVTAEGIGTAETLGKLRDLGCDVLQGAYLMRPLAAEDLAGLLRLD